ncbi:MAG: hypothetical protein KOO64_03250 [Desulfobacterales bacterium]|nr:hypothetical protein [Desulfobacterales bacterium]
MKAINNISVLGLGTLGAQIALQAASKGFTVTGYDPVKNSLKNYLAKIPNPQNNKTNKILFDVSSWFPAIKKIKVLDSLAEAVKQADLIVEAVPEDLEVKLKTWREIDAFAPSHSILSTNSSSMPVSKLENVTSRPEMCLNIHVYQLVFGHTMADIMGGTRTAPEVLEAGRQFARALGLVPLTVNKELLGFCFNRVWRAIKRESLYMWAEGFVDHQDIDRAYMIFNGTSWGPFALMDAVGLDVVWDIEMVYYNESENTLDHPPQALKEKIEAGELGVKSGKGFYTYPNPAFSSLDFLKP